MPTLFDRAHDDVGDMYDYPYPLPVPVNIKALSVLNMF